MYDAIKCETSEGICTITLNRPEQMNAFHAHMVNELIDALKKADEDDTVRVLIVTGAGKAFSAGADLSSASGAIEKHTKMSDEDIRNYRDGAGMITLTIYDMKKPIIAAINGVAVGMGATITLPMDIRLASENARFGFVFSRRGLVSEGASSWFLPHVVGAGKALEWILTGRVFDAREAEKYGLVQEVLEPDALMLRARTIAMEIVQSTSAVSVALCRQLVWKMMGAASPWEAHRMDSMATAWSFIHPDVVEGFKSFLEKRPPKFPMKPSKDMPDFYPWWKEQPS